MAPETIDQGQLEEIFQIFDNRGDGCIDVSLVGDVLRATGLNPTEADIRKCCEDFNPNINSNNNNNKKKNEPEPRITFEMFIPIYHQIAKNRDRYSYDDLVEGMRHFDHDGSGTILAAELRHLLTALGEKLTEDEVEQLLDNNMVNDEGRVNYEQFVKSIMNS